MSLSKIPAANTLVDKQVVTVIGPDGLPQIFRYDAQSNSLIGRESEVIFSGNHGPSHISEDPIPEATCSSPGLMSKNDKCKLDHMTQTRIGVAGFQGAGFPDDGGWMQEDIVLAAGTEFISLERFGNVVRFTVDSPIPLNCACESCNQIFFVQDESDISAIRPPVCSGKLPGINGYGEFKIFQFPQSTQISTTNSATILASKGDYPTLQFRRYTGGLTTSEALLEVVLKRNAVNKTTTEVGWYFSPGSSGAAECVWTVGRDNDSNLVKFELNLNSEPGLLGALLYKGHRLTKQMGVITGYASTVVSTNQYTCRYWNVNDGLAVGSAFTATNVWQYNNPEQPTSGLTPKSLEVDATYGVLPIGTLVDLWEYEVGRLNNIPSYRRYFARRPATDLATAWTPIGSVEFGNTEVARYDVQPGEDIEDSDLSIEVDDLRMMESTIWGLSGPSSPVTEVGGVSTDGTDATILNTADVITIDTDLPGMRILEDATQTSFFAARPVFLWNKIAHNNSLISMEIGKPSIDSFPPYDILLHAPIDSHDPVFLEVVEIGTIGGLNMIRVKGAHFHDLPKRGTVRILTQSDVQNGVFRYGFKYINPTADLDSLVLASPADDNYAYVGSVGDVVELLHDDYTAPCVRVEFNIGEDGSISTQFLVGTLDMGVQYQGDYNGHLDNLVRGMAPGYAVSPIYIQDGPYDGTGDRPTTLPTDFICYEGGYGSDDAEYWNELEIMQRDDQVWIWWNQFLISPSPTLSAGLEAPATVSTPYFPITLPAARSGKVGFRLWPGCKLRRAEVRTQAKRFSEYKYGQVSIT